MNFLSRSLVLITIIWSFTTLAEGVDGDERNSHDNFGVEDSSHQSFSLASGDTYGVCVPVPGRPGYYFIYFCTGPVKNISKECTYSTISSYCG
jgi:hypothetical protein